MEGKYFSNFQYTTNEMPRRRVVRLSYSSDEDDGGDDNQQPPADDLDRQSTVTHQSGNPSNIHTETVEISDEEFVDVSDNLSLPSPPQPPMFFSTCTPPSSGSVSGQSSDCPVSDFLREIGLNLRREWLDSCIQGCQSSVIGFDSLDVAGKAQVCFEQFLFSDMNYSGGGVLPENVNSMHLVDLAGPFVLQVDEIVNISCPLRGRYHTATSGIKRCLKLCMTDGVQRVFGIEYRPIKFLEVLAPSGLKVAVCNVNVRHGLLMLVPEALEVLGGLVEELDAARQRLVTEVNKPPRGKRTRTGVLPSLAARATLAAWPSNGVNDPRHTNSSTPPGSNSFQAGAHGAALAPCQSNGTNVHTVNRTGPSASSFHAVGQRANFAVSSPHGVGDPWHTNGTIAPVATSFETDGRGTTFPGRPSNGVNIPGDTSNANSIWAVCRGAINTSCSSSEYFTLPINEETSVPNPPSNGILDVEDVYMDTGSLSNRNALPNLSAGAVLDAEDVHMVDEPELSHILSGNLEVPFTYLASLSVKWAASEGKANSVQGKVKCFLTGVKGFQYKQRTTYELRVYVDDGSLISEILIDHNVVQKGIGYSPQEVTAALSSSDKKIVSDMKETLKQFQIFLVTFEGIMLVEINETSPLPVALEMNQGCSASDAWLLLRRLKSSTAAQTIQQCPLEPIDLSP